MTGNDILYLVIPCYNEEAVLHETAKQLLAKMNSMFDRGMISRESKIMFVNDGSKDRTWEIIKELHESNPIYSGVKLSRNKGHQNALLAGLMTAKEKADMAISLDADLQDDVNVIDKMVRSITRETTWYTASGAPGIQTPSLKNSPPRASIRSCRPWAWKLCSTMRITVS